MKTIRLTAEQRKKLMNALAEVRNEEGRFEKEVLLDEDLLIVARGSMDVDCYQESGTGG